MKRALLIRSLLILTFTFLVAGMVFAQEPSEPKKEEPSAESAEKKEAAEKQESKDLIYKSVNFVLLFGLLGYFLGKPATQFFQSRTEAIQKGMADAKIAREAADKRLDEIELKLSHLSADIGAMQAEAAKEDAAQAERMRRQTEEEGAKIHSGAESEIDTMTRAARLELKAYAAKLAVDLAEERLKSELNPQVHPAAQERLVNAYVQDLGGKN